MANQNVVDELVVKLSLDSKAYEDSDKKINKAVATTEKKAQDIDAKRRRRDADQTKRWKEASTASAQFAKSLEKLALTTASVVGVGGGVGGLIAAVTGLTDFETNLRRAAVSTGFSNREMQAWGSAARRLGADATAGAAAIAALAKEQKQFTLTGSGPTMQAFARMGVRVGPSVSVQDMLGQAQALYRSSAPAQQQQQEALLAAQGVSPDLIIAIKSSKDVVTEFARSMDQATTENRRALDSVADAVATAKDGLIGMSNTIAGLLSPAFQGFADAVGEGSRALSSFADQAANAGGGVEGFIKTLTAKSPIMADAAQAIIEAFRGIGEVIDVATYGFDQLYKAIAAFGTWLNSFSFVRTLLQGAQMQAKPGQKPQKGLWDDLVVEARNKGPSPVANILGMRKDTGIGSVTGDANKTTVPGNEAQRMMGDLIMGYGLTVPQAAAVVANFSRESNLNPSAVNMAGGGQGARGLGQWRGSRIDAFRKRYGVTPDQATASEQLQFLMTDPYERSKLNKSLASGGAYELGANFSRVFEAHGSIDEDIKRGALAQKLAQSYPAGGVNNTTNAPINIQTVNVHANNPGELVGGIKRLSGVQNYNAAVR